MMVDLPASPKAMPSRSKVWLAVAFGTTWALLVLVAMIGGPIAGLCVIFTWMTTVVYARYTFWRGLQYEAEQKETS